MSLISRRRSITDHDQTRSGGPSVATEARAERVRSDAGPRTVYTQLRRGRAAGSGVDSGVAAVTVRVPR